MGMPEDLVQISEKYRLGLQILYQRCGYHGLSLTMQQAQVGLVKLAQLKHQTQAGRAFVACIYLPR